MIDLTPLGLSNQVCSDISNDSQSYDELQWLIRGYEVAQNAHAGQVDRVGKPYITHPEAVCRMVASLPLKTAAILHDVVEDTPITLDDLKAMGFSSDIVHWVDLLTHREEDDYFDYIERLQSNPCAVAIKLADLSHNSDTSRLPEITDADLKRLAKYRRAKEMLEK